MKRSIMILAAAAALLCSCTENEPSSVSSSETTQTTISSQAEPSSSVPESIPEPEPEPETSEIYDTSPISDAYLSGDSSALDVYQQAVLEKAKEVISKVITDDMTDYEKELAIHDYLVYNATYDEEELSALSESSYRHSEPYGALIEGKAICSGYSTTFKMFMDMLGIPCELIHATAHGGNEHAWNMVELDGHWYYVDVTWDDPVPDFDGREVIHGFFNVSTEKMKEEHEWDTDDLPETDSAEYSYTKQSCKELDTVDDAVPYLEELLSQKRSDGTFRINGMDIDMAAGTKIYPDHRKNKSSDIEAIKDALDEWHKENKKYILSVRVAEAQGEKYFSIEATSFRL
ncbi:MAG: transglutaminase [Ruminococcus sp.]|nr:transglutaminase [Ruminococcus sp.]